MAYLHDDAPHAVRVMALSFFRSLAGAVGVAVLGAILATQVARRTATGLSAIGVSGAGAGDGSLDLNDLPAPVEAVVRAAYGDSFGELFLIAAAAAVLTLVTVFLVKEVPLRNTVEMRPEAAGDVSAALAEDSGREARGLEGPKAEAAVETTGTTETWDDPAARRLIMAAGGLAPEHVPWLVRAGVSMFQVSGQVRPLGSWKAYVDADLVGTWRALLDSEAGTRA